ncbi:MAG: DHH family phosphoesterase [Acidimicrobiia bacterium]|nr:DHH family phosphoesterase [Acidimicrobiia bacterium]
MADPGVDAGLARVAAAVTAAEEVALACHVHPDGDALGSVLAFHLLCRAHGVASVASWGEPFTVAPHYRFLPGLDQASSPSAFPDRPELMVTFDCGSLARLGELAAPAGQADELVVLDHHHDNARYGSINVVDTGAASTATVVRRLAEVLGWDLDYEVAFDLYVGLLTDTGRFQYPNTTSEVFTLAQELAGHGLPLGVITRELFEKHRFAYLRLAAASLARASLDRRHRVVAAWVTAEDLATYGVDFDETEGLIDLVRQTAEADVSCVLKEAPGEGLRVSLRSVTGVDVGRVAAELGGGGHHFMAGFLSDRSIPATIERIVDLVTDLAPAPV